MRQRLKNERGKWRRLGWLDDNCAARRQSRGDLARDHRHREIPRRDCCARPDRLTNCERAAVRGKAWDHLTIGALALLCEPFDIGCAIGNFALRLTKWLAALHAHDPGKLIAIKQDQLVPAPQYVRALLGSLHLPVGADRICLIDDGGHHVAIMALHAGNQLVIGGIIDGNAVRIAEAVVDQR